jgi:outer membrane lipoprotein SlyB
MARSRAALLILCLTAPLAACGPDYSPNTYSGAAAQQANKVDQGVVVGVRRVDIRAQTTTGAVTGGAVGGIAGSQAPGSGVVSAIGALGGSLIGGIVGSSVEQSATDTTAYEYIVRKPNGELVSVTQKDEIPLSLGQHVLVIAGNQARIVPDYTQPTASPPNPMPAPPSISAKPLEPPASAPKASEPQSSSVELPKEQPAEDKPAE